MSQDSFDFTPLFSPNLPDPSFKWDGVYPRFNFTGGHNAPELVPVDDFIDAATSVLKREGQSLATYFVGGMLGYQPLREFLAKKLKETAGIDCDADEILLTSGSMQGIDLVNKVFLSPGDTVIIEEATYGSCLGRFARAGVTPIGIPLDEGGMCLDKLEEALELCKAKGVHPKYIYVIPTIQNPTATIMSEARRQKLIDLAVKYDVPIFEDECYSDLIWDGERPPSIYAMDTTRRTIFIGSFSKSVAPALRVGYLVADWSVLAQIVGCKGDAGSGALEQMMLAEYCNKHFDDHVSGLRVALKEKSEALLGAMEEHFGTSAEYDVPPGGIFLWIKLPDSVDTSKLAMDALGEGIFINAGAEWSVSKEATRYFRICFANPDVETIREGVAKLAEVCHREFGVPERIANRKQR